MIPSSPNIVAKYINPNFATPDQHPGYINTVGSTVNYYFKELKYPYGSTPDTILFTVSSAATPIYPFKRDKFEYFEELSTPMVQAIVDKNGIVRYDIDNWDETFSKNSNIVGRYQLTYDTFGLDKENDYIEKIEIVNNQQDVELYVSNQYVKVDFEDGPFDWMQNAIIEYDEGILSDVEVTAKYKGSYSSYLNNGWYYHNNEENYIYSTPITENFATPGFSVLLSNVVRQGAPIIVERLHATPAVLREVAFYNEATPTNISIVNEEKVKANKGNKLYLGYEDIYDLSVYDTVTGYQMTSGAQSTTNYIEVFNTSTPPVFEREYSAQYKVRDSYIVDNDYWDSNSSKYVSKIDFDSTPNQFYSYTVTYEASELFQATPISLQVDPMKMWDDEGFIYLSHFDYSFNSFELKLSPSHISDNSNEIMFLTAVSLDENGNPKPYQTFSVSGSVIATDQQYYTTDINGFAAVRIYYAGPIPATSTTSQIVVSGVNDGSINAHPNSQTEGYNSSISFDISTVYNTSVDLKAVSDTPIMPADGVSQNYIYGYVSDGATPASSKIVYWRKARTVYDVLENSSYSQYVSTDANGKFTIGPFTSSSGTEPGIWFVAVETENAATVNYSPQTVSGDIVYWYEKYDNLNYFYENSLLYTNDVLYGQSQEMYSTPIFTVNYSNGEYATPYSSAPNWTPPKWYPIDRYKQYMMGLLGSTPYYVNSYSSLINEYEED